MAEVEHADERHDDGLLTDLLTETRILLPGTQVFLGFLATLPFSQRFTELDGLRQMVYVLTFFATVLALIFFVVPAAYHRIARPIHHKDRFKELANRFLVVGLVPLSASMVLATYLISSMVIDGLAICLSATIFVLIGLIWWLMPLVRYHNRMKSRGLP